MHSNWPEIETAVVQSFLNGEEAAFRIIYQSFAPALLAYATAICGSREQAEDIVQDVFVVCWEKKWQIKIDALPNWLVKVTKNMSVKAFRRNVLTAEYATDIANAPGEELSAEHIAFAHFREAQAMKIVDALPAARKKIFLLSRIHQKSYRQIADELGISVRTVENQLSAALKHIRYQLTISDTIFLLLILLKPF
jgi:RNA polymerase sigma-70 factor, ECF subfamily